MPTRGDRIGVDADGEPVAETVLVPTWEEFTQLCDVVASLDETARERLAALMSSP